MCRPCSHGVRRTEELLGGAWTSGEAKKHRGELKDCAAEFVALGKAEEADLEGEGAESELLAIHAKF